MTQPATNLTQNDIALLRESLEFITTSHPLEPHLQIAYQKLLNHFDAITGKTSSPFQFANLRPRAGSPIVISDLAPAHVVATVEQIGVILKRHGLTINASFVCTLTGSVEGADESSLQEIADDLFALGISIDLPTRLRGETLEAALAVHHANN